MHLPAEKAVLDSTSLKLVQRTPHGGRLAPWRTIASWSLRPFLKLIGGLSLLAAAGSACSTGEPAAPAPGAEALRTPTYHRDVEPILRQNCVKCHHEGGVGPFALTSYDLARSMAPALAAEVTALRMPPWGAHDTDECQVPLPWRGDERLSKEAIDIFRRWDVAGAPEGDPREAPAVIAPTQSLELVGPAVEVLPERPFQPAASSRDEFRCIVVDSPAAQQGGYISAIDVIPGNRQVVHHVTAYADVGGIASSRAGADGSFDCSTFAAGGGSIFNKVNGVPPHLALLIAWAPGGKPLELPPELGIELPPNSKILMEVHYSTGGKQVEPDRTGLRLAMAPTTPPYAIVSWNIGNRGRLEPNGDGLQPGEGDVDGVVEFRVPANARDHVETMLTTAGPYAEPMPIFGIRAHAHFGAVDIKLDVLRGDAKQCLLQDQWDVHWQRIYTYDAPIERLPKLYGGEKLRLRCTFDNSMMNRRLGPELWSRGIPPMDLTLGDESLNEMCMADVLLVRKTY